MKALYLDCFAGISGNMFLGALLDVGWSEQDLRNTLSALPIEGYSLIVNKVVKNGITAHYVDVKVTEHQAHRHLSHILDIINSSTLEENIKATAGKVFLRLAEAEAKVHGTTVEHVHFHEVGAVDTIIDIVGTAAGLAALNIETIYVSKLQVGSGFVKCAHGVIPVPAPATLELLKDIPYYKGDSGKELVTPTGAALISTLADGFGEIPANFITNKIGYGAGYWDLSFPNVLRLQLGTIDRTPEKMLVIEANIDDMNPQLYGYVMEKLFSAGAADVWFTPIYMKKDRPATNLSVLAAEEHKQKIFTILFSETSTIGIRYYPVNRTVAKRDVMSVRIPGGDIRIKVAWYNDKVCNVSPEFEDCVRISREQGIALKDLQRMVVSAAYNKLNPVKEG